MKYWWHIKVLKHSIDRTINGLTKRTFFCSCGKCWTVVTDY